MFNAGDARFNSKLVRLKANSLKVSNADTYVSIPNWCD